MRPITSSCRPHTAGRRRYAWRRLGLIALNLALWGGLITLARMVLS